MNILTHPWQEKKLGVAPFRCVCVISMPSKALLEAGNVDAYNNQASDACAQARHFGVHLCTCDVCGMALTNNFVIRDVIGKHFVVGCDCVEHTGDSKLMTEVAYYNKKRLDAIKAKKRQVESLKRQAARKAELAAQRERNSGLTDEEIETNKRNAEREALQAQFKAKNAWLISVLDQVQYGSDFVTSMIGSLLCKNVADLSPRCQDILSDIYAKTKSGARRGSKAYDAAMNEFDVLSSKEAV